MKKFYFTLCPIVNFIIKDVYKKKFKLFLLFYILGMISLTCKKDQIPSSKEDQIPPSEVKDLKIIDGAYSDTLTWMDPSDNDFDKVEITYSDSSGSYKFEVLKGIQRKILNNLKSGITYSFAVRTIDINNNISNGIQIVGTPDYRNIFIGNYLFKSIIFIDYNSTHIVNDTIEYIGAIEKYENKKLKIVYMPDYNEPDLKNKSFPIPINGLIYPTIDSTGVLSYPNSPYYFEGKFNKIDSVYFSYEEFEHVGKEKVRIYGKRITKK